MESLNYWRINSTTLWRGAALQVALCIDDERARPPEAEVTFPEVRLALVSSSGSHASRAGLLAVEPVLPIWTARDGRSFFEIHTDELLRGAYEIQLFLREREILNLPEELWIVDPEEYLQLALEAGREGFLPAPRVQGGAAAFSYVASVIQKRLREDRFGREGRADEVRVWGQEGLPTTEASFAINMIRWTTDRVVDAFRVLALPGVRAATWYVALTEENFSVMVKCELLEPVTEMAIRYVMDPRLGLLQMMNLENDLWNLSLRVDAAAGETRFELAIGHTIDAELEVGGGTGPAAAMMTPAKAVAEPPIEEVEDDGSIERLIKDFADEAAVDEAATEGPIGDLGAGRDRSSED
jgi:hypothetical protein